MFAKNTEEKGGGKIERLKDKFMLRIQNIERRKLGWTSEKKNKV